jgi:hypothetical protein
MYSNIVCICVLSVDNCTIFVFQACMVDPEDKTELDLDTEFLPPMSYLSSRLGSLLLHLLHALAHVYLWLAIYKIE